MATMALGGMQQVAGHQAAGAAVQGRNRAKLKKGNLVLEWKPLPGEIAVNPMSKFKGNHLRQQALKLTLEEVTAFSNVFSSTQEN